MTTASYVEAPEAETPTMTGVQPRSRFQRFQRAVDISAKIFCWIFFATVLASFFAITIADGVAPAASQIVSKYSQGQPLQRMTVLTQSMQPVYFPGDDVIIQHQDDVRSYKVGDVVTYQPVSGDASFLITHRITSVSLGNGPDSVNGVAGFTTKGDANNIPDEPIVPGQVVGKVMYGVPYVGYVNQWFAGISVATKLQWLGGCAVAFALWVMIPWRKAFGRLRGRH
ncbi:signal peptidase I [Pseudarthrobacter phenanthrenivorans]|uniref:signal peptidase I n=1 Tax=Pseudarthrobacter phenanthrenivorans TaxID=361575 RepID=UPI00068BD640|nr:signal peptidase I [Pseudarthrobacter phenanthrenivorans]